MKNIMIIGAGLGQIDGIRTAKKMGLKVIAIDRNPNAIGVKEADVFLNIDVTDIKNAVHAAKEYKINGVITLQSDLPVPTVGAVIDSLNLVGTGFIEAKKCSNKLTANKLLLKNGVPCPRSIGVKTIYSAYDAVKKIGLPVIVKAVDSSGSRGVSKVIDIKQLPSAFKNSITYSKEKTVVIEEFLQGKEIGAQVFLYRGECLLILLHNDTLSDYPYFVPIGHSYPSNLPDSIVRDVENIIEKAVVVLSLTDGPINIDLIITESGPKILEIGARMGATCLPLLTSEYTGIDYVEQSIKVAIGDIPNIDIKWHQPCAALIFEAPKDGYLRNIIIPEYINNIDGLIDLKIEADIGTAVQKFRNGTDKIGHVVVRDKTWDFAEKKVKLIKDNIKFIVQ